MTEPTKEAIEAASDFIPAKMGHTLRIALAVAFDAFAAQRVAEAEERTIERCAKVVEDGQESHRSSATEDMYYLSPRTRNNLAGLAYAAAIRALKEPRR
jgi:hypothetical protein